MVVDGQITYNNIMPVLQGAVAARAWRTFHSSLSHPLADARLIEVLGDWCPHFQGYPLLSAPAVFLPGVRRLGGLTSISR